MATILAIDDSVSMRQMISFTLKQGGHDTIMAYDGQDAMDKAKTQTPDLVIADLNMPRIDGIGLIPELRELPNYRHIPMLLLTTESAGDVKARGKAAGATGWVVKPFDPNKLLSTLDTVIR